MGIMRTPPISIWPCLVLALTCLAPHPVAAQDAAGENVEDVFFEALDLKQGGQCAFAVGRFQLCLQLDPTLHQARLHLAECYQALGEHEAALREARAYLDADFPEAELDRAKAVISASSSALGASSDGGQDAGADGGKPDGDAASDGGKTGSDSGKTGSGGGKPQPDGGATGDRPTQVRIETGFPGDTPRRFAHARIGTGLLITHFANEAQLTALGPLVDARFLLGEYVELGVTARVAMGPYPERGGTVTVPEFGGAVGVSIPLKGPRLTIGALIPIVLSGFGGDTRADGGILAEVGIHVPVKETPLVIDGVFEGGYLVSAAVGGRVGVSFQLGPRRLP